MGRKASPTLHVGVDVGPVSSADENQTCVFFPWYVQWSHSGRLKSAMVVVFTQGKLENATNQGLFSGEPVFKHLPTHQWTWGSESPAFTIYLSFCPCSCPVLYLPLPFYDGLLLGPAGLMLWWIMVGSPWLSVIWWSVVKHSVSARRLS